MASPVPSAYPSIEVGAWYCFVTTRDDGTEDFGGIYQFLGENTWGDECEALEPTPDYDRLVRQ